MLDHVFTDAIGAIRDALEAAMLERQAIEERFQTDVLLGDITWETSYALPGEGSPPRVRTDVTLAWPTWAQTAYRTWFLDEEFSEGPRIEIEVVFRVQETDAAPSPESVARAVPEPPNIGVEAFEFESLAVETTMDADLEVREHAVELTFQGSYELDEATLADGSILDERFGAIGGWVASALVRLGDLPTAPGPGTDPRSGHGE